MTVPSQERSETAQGGCFSPRSLLLPSVPAPIPFRLPGPAKPLPGLTGPVTHLAQPPARPFLSRQSAHRDSGRSLCGFSCLSPPSGLWPACPPSRQTASYWVWKVVARAHLALWRCAGLCSTDAAVGTVKVCDSQPCVGRVTWAPSFPNASAPFVSPSRLGNAPRISGFFVMIVFAVVVCGP